MRHMKIALLCALLAMLQGCAGCQQDWSHVKSFTAGLDRHITLYANDGRILKEWDISGTVEDQGGSFRFMYQGKAITVAGTVLVEEK